MFYENQPVENQNQYKKMLTIMGNLSLLFSENNCPYLLYRAHENIFCKYFSAENLSRFDCSADAKKETIGIGLKTWISNDDQKVAEFGKLRETYAKLTGLELVKKISAYRNKRIRVTKNLHAIKTMIYHVVKRIPNAMQIIEQSFDFIDINNIRIISERGNVNNTYFTDNNHTYHFSISKNTLYMIFEDYKVLDQFEVKIMSDPYSILMNLSNELKAEQNIGFVREDLTNKLCLRLYSYSKSKDNFVPEKSGLNQWNASGRKRNPNEIYIPYPAKDRARNKGFFPVGDITFDLTLPNGETIPAKICQADGKAIMSNPNKILGEWLLRNVFELKKRELITYKMLEMYGIDSVIFTKESDLKYSIDFSEIGTYEEFYNNQKIDE